MVKKRINSEKNIEDSNFKLKIGTTNKKSPKTVYIEGGCFIMPNEDKENYTEELEEIKIRFNELAKKVAKNAMCNEGKIFDGKTITSFEIAEDRVMPKKKSYMSFQVHFKQKGERNVDDIFNDLEVLSSFITVNLGHTIEEKGFSYSKTKN